MRKIFHVVLVVVSLGLFVGCQQKTVTDDRYVTHGFPDVTMQGFTYEGNLTFDLNTLCADAVCRPYSSTSADAYADVYVAVGGSGQPMELCAFQRERLLGNRVQWGPVGGEKVMFAGSEYREDVAFYHLGDESYLYSYEVFLAQRGFDYKGEGFALYSLSRNTNQKSRSTILYAVDVESMPRAVQQDTDSWRAYLRERFREAVVIQ